jgi:hypothetical protein
LFLYFAGVREVEHEQLLYDVLQELFDENLLSGSEWYDEIRIMNFIINYSYGIAGKSK